MWRVNRCPGSWLKVSAIPERGIQLAKYAGHRVEYRILELTDAVASCSDLDDLR